LSLLFYLFGGSFVTWFKRCFVFFTFHNGYILYSGGEVNAV
jgi:hypothetical protein